jgi:hypothetical protein
MFAFETGMQLFSGETMPPKLPELSLINDERSSLIIAYLSLNVFVELF